MHSQNQQQPNHKEQKHESNQNNEQFGSEKHESEISIKDSESEKKIKHQIKNRTGLASKERRRIKSETWNYLEIKKIFKLYEQYGSQWKIMETQFVDRVANSIKNRFYTVIRTLLKILFRQHPSIIQKLPHEIPSKVILQFFEGREDFTRFKGFGKKILKMIKYDLQSPQIKKIVEENNAEIIALYELIFDIKCPEKEQNSIPNRQVNKCQSLGNLQQQLQEEMPEYKRSPKSTPIELFKTKTDLSQTVGDVVSNQYLHPNAYQGIIFIMPIPSFFEGTTVYPYYKPY